MTDAPEEAIPQTQADTQAEKSKYFNGKESYPSHYFEAARLASNSGSASTVLTSR